MDWANTSASEGILSLTVRFFSDVGGDFREGWC
jgi:hypothetical protein